MTDCNATLTTLTVTDEVVTKFLPGIGGALTLESQDFPDGQTVTRDGDRLLRADVTVLTCERTDDHHSHYVGKPGPSSFVCWTDDTEGATPHACSHPTVVGDGQGNEWCHDCNTPGATPHVGMSETNRHDDPDYDGYRVDINDNMTLIVTGDKIRLFIDGEQVMTHVLAAKHVPLVAYDNFDAADAEIVDWSGAWSIQDPCPDCDGEGVNPESALDRYVCPSCGGSGTAPTVTDDMIDAACVAWSRSFDDPKMTLASQLRDIINAALAARPAVTDAEVEAAMQAMTDAFVAWNDDATIIRAALEAAARARQENR